jgi:hypothetical protein
MFYASYQRMLKRALRKAVRLAREWLREDRPQPDLSFYYPWMAHLHRTVLAESGVGRPAYAWGVLGASYLAKVLGIERISALELGVAGGMGLTALERISEATGRLLGIGIDVYGFDTGQGMPKPVDLRDLPNLYSEGDYGMDADKLRRRLQNATLVLGPVKQTVAGFLSSRPAPVGFVSFDLDYYSSTKDALGLLLAPPQLLLPRVQCYLDDILGYSFAEFNGERLAVAEFNGSHDMRKVSKVYGLRYLLPEEHANAAWPEKVYQAFILDHPRYWENDGTMSRTLPSVG